MTNNQLVAIDPTNLETITGGTAHEAPPPVLGNPGGLFGGPGRTGRTPPTLPSQPRGGWLRRAVDEAQTINRPAPLVPQLLK